MILLSVDLDISWFFHENLKYFVKLNLHILMFLRKISYEYFYQKNI